MAMFAMRTIFTNLAIKDVHKTEMAGFVNFNTLAQWNEIYTIIVSIIVFCASLKFLKLLRFNKRIGMLASTLRYAAKDLLSFSFTFGVFFFAFTMVSYCVFGPYMDSYKSFMSALGSQFRFALGQYDFKGLIDANLMLGAIYFVSFILIVIMGRQFGKLVVIIGRECGILIIIMGRECGMSGLRMKRKCDMSRLRMRRKCDMSGLRMRGCGIL